MDVTRDTIYAPATASGLAAIAIVRVSGPQAGAALDALGAGRSRARPRVATRARLVDQESGAPLDDALTLWFPATASATGEDVAELHLHGGHAVLAGVLDALARLPGFRLARPGEFARRAFDAGKLDLAQVEALADLVNAETQAQARQALAQLGGRLGAACEEWRERLLTAQARLEAEIDFPDEDLPHGLAAALAPDLARIGEEIGAALADSRAGERLRDGFRIAILGPPNAGKSSLLNALAGRDAAIVSHVAGTTRDVVEVHLELEGFPVLLADTAGLHAPGDASDAHDAIEVEGMRRARLRAEAADLKLIVVEAPHARAQLAAPEIASLLGPDAIVAVNKIDLARPPDFAGEAVVPISATTGEGVARLVAALAARAALALGRWAGAGVLAPRARHREALEECRAALARAVAAREAELQAEDLRLAARALGRITGRVDVEEMLDRLFAELCIGK